MNGKGSRSRTSAFREGYDRIFRKPKGVDHNFVCCICGAPATHDDRGWRLSGQPFFAAYCEEHVPRRKMPG